MIKTTRSLNEDLFGTFLGFSERAPATKIGFKASDFLATFFEPNFK